MLTPDQISSVRQAAGKSPTPQGPGTSGSLADDFASAWTKQPSYSDRVGATESAGADMTANAFKTGAENITHDFKDLTDNAGTNPAIEALRALVFAGHTAGNIASTAAGVGMGTLKAAAAPFTQIKTPEGEQQIKGANPFNAPSNGGKTIGESFAEPLKKTTSDVVENVRQTHPELVKTWESLTPDVQKGVMDVLNTTGLLGGGKIVGGDVQGVGGTLKTLSDAGKDMTNTAIKGADAVAEIPGKIKNAAVGAVDAVKGKTANTFQDVYNAHAQSSKPLSNALKGNTITKDGKTITPIDTMEKYQAAPKVSGNTKGGHVLDMTEVKDEATANSKAASKAVDAQVKDIQQPLSKKELQSAALDAAQGDKEIVRTASLPAVTRQIKQIFSDYGIKGDKLTAQEVNEFRKGANQASQAYYNAQRIAGVAGTIPKDVADRAQAFAVLGDVFREKLVALDPTLDAALTEQRIHNAVQQYATRAHLSSVGLPGSTRAMVDAASAGGGALVGSTMGPAGTVLGAGAGVGISEKLQGALLRRTYEGATKNQAVKALSQSSKTSTPAAADTSISMSKSVPQEGKVSKYLRENPPSLGLATKKAVPDPQVVAQDLTPRNIKVIRNYIDLDQGRISAGGNADFEASTAFDDFLTQEGIDPSLFATEKAKAAYAADLIDHHQAALNEATKQPRTKTGQFDKKVNGISKELEPLAAEARKYKSADEFVDNNYADYSTYFGGKGYTSNTTGRTVMGIGGKRYGQTNPQDKFDKLTDFYKRVTGNK